MNRAEAAERLSDNHEAAIADILKNSLVQNLAADGDISAIKDAVDLHLRLLAEYLINGNIIPSIARSHSIPYPPKPPNLLLKLV